ncbi:MAG: hypothetical protein ACYTGC_16000 [Planctomycetota bacterium]|jgi:hypothetical protein
MGKRIVLLTAMHLLLGLVIALAVAWLCIGRRPGPNAARFSSPIWLDEEGLVWAGGGASGLGWAEIRLFGMGNATLANPDLTERVPHWVPREHPEQHAERAIMAVVGGWPLPCLRAWRFGRGDDTPGPGGTIRTGLGPQRVDWSPWRHALTPGGDQAALPGTSRVFPLGALPLGLAIDGAVWGALGALPWLVIPVRRALRRRRRQCAACGYPRGAGPTCTECGASFR